MTVKSSAAKALAILAPVPEAHPAPNQRRSDSCLLNRLAKLRLLEPVKDDCGDGYIAYNVDNDGGYDERGGQMSQLEFRPAASVTRAVIPDSASLPSAAIALAGGVSAP